MAKSILAFGLLLLVGCGRVSEEDAVERQKLLVEELDMQRKNLTALNEKEKEHEETLREIKREREALRQTKTEQELRLQAILKAKEEVRNLLQELRKEAANQEAKAELAQHRGPFLEKLAIIACNHISLYAEPPPHMKQRPDSFDSATWKRFRHQVESWYRDKLLSELQASGLLVIESDDEFEKAAKQAARIFLKRTGRAERSEWKWVDRIVEKMEAVHVER